jgi:hypothetical protein
MKYSGISVVRLLGLAVLFTEPGRFVGTWLQSYVSAWIIAYPILLLLIPLVRRAVNALADE